MSGAAGWKTAYAAMHQDGAADFPPACLHYVLDMVRGAARDGEGSLTPAATIAAFRRSTRADFGPLADEVLADWEMRTPENLGRAVTLLGRYGCLALDAGDTAENFAADTLPLVPSTRVPGGVS